MRFHAAALAVGLGGVTVAAWALLRRRTTMTIPELATYLVQRAAPTVAPWASDVAAAAIQTLPRDYHPPDAQGDADAELRRWALVLAAIGDHESGFGNAPGYTPRGDPAGWGDKGNAFGFFQLDRHYFWHFIQTPGAASVTQQGIIAGGLLKSNFSTFAKWAFPERERLSVITYNASRTRVVQLLAQGGSVEDADATTSKIAGVPYGTDVLARVEEWS
jgi:hypothetical protein